MVYLCCYELCKDKEIPEGEAYACNKSGAKKTFHKACAIKHVAERYWGEAKISRLDSFEPAEPAESGNNP